MNVIAISNFDQFDLILNDSLCFSGGQSEEIYHNMWCIALEGELIESIIFRQLRYFADKLIENREQQLKDSNIHRNAVFYMWFDQQALQLRFNVITNDILPFECKVHQVPGYEVVLETFINTVREISHHGDPVEFFDNGDWEEENEHKEEYVLNVFAKRLRHDQRVLLK